jgi:hypothetical protein
MEGVDFRVFCGLGAELQKTALATIRDVIEPANMRSCIGLDEINPTLASVENAI